MTLISHIFKYIRGKRPLIGVPVIIQNSQGEILLGKRDNKAPFYPNTWGLPGGMMEYNELPEETAKREVKEELGIDIDIKKKLDIHNNLPNKEHKIHLIDIPFIAKIKDKQKPGPKDETKKVRWFKTSKIKNMKLAYGHNEILAREGLI